MTNPPHSNKRTRSTLRALVVYLGVSWLVMQFIDTLISLLSLPSWLGTATVVVLTVGLPIVLATAWVQSLAATTAAEEAGEVPTDWEVAPADAIAEIMAGKLPHLTWGRAILGGVVALSLTIGAAGGYVLITGSDGLRSQGSTAVLDRAVAVLPFFVTGGVELEPLGEGMVVLLSENLDGVGDLRAVNHRTVMARWAEEGGDSQRLDLPAQLRVASNAGARYALSGSVVSLGETARFTVDIHDLAAGRDLGRAEGVGSPADIFALVDGLSVDIVREILGTEEAQTAEAMSLASITTHSVQALNAYLSGVKAFRESRMNDAASFFDDALAIDSTFALGWVRLDEVIGWDGVSVHERDFVKLQARTWASSLAPRERMIAEARDRFDAEDPRIEGLLREYLQRYPDDGQAWFLLGDAYFHWLVPSRPDSIRAAFRRAVDFDPGHTPHWRHLFEIEAALGDAEGARIARDAILSQADPGSESAIRAQNLYGLFFGTDAEYEEAMARAPGATLGDLGFASDQMAREVEFWRASIDTNPGNTPNLAMALVNAGRPREAVATAAPIAPEMAASMAAAIEFEFGIDMGVHDQIPDENCGLDFQCLFPYWTIVAMHGMGTGHADEVALAAEGMRRALPPFREAVAGQPRSHLAIGEVEAGILWLSGDTQGGLDGLRAMVDSVGQLEQSTGLFPYAALQVGDLATAERFYRSASWHGPSRASSTWQLAQILEELGRPEEALEQYRRLTVMWSDAEADFTPADEVRAAIARLEDG